MKSIGEAYAKINLSLDIVSKMDDGYHYLQTVMQTVRLCDTVTIECAHRDAGESDIQIIVQTDRAHIPNDERNIAHKAAGVFYESTGITGYTVKIRIDKKIPVCAGLGGGSADAACVLRMLDEIHNTALGSGELEKLAYSVGADVPYCIKGGTQLAEGRGEILTVLPPLPALSTVICKPQFSCSTPELFGNVDCRKIRTSPDTEGLIKALEAGDYGGVAKRMYNVFEDVLLHIDLAVKNGRHTGIVEIKNALLDNGALGAVMTGSGSAVFGLFDDAGKATAAFEKLSLTYKECYLTETVNK